MAERGGGSIVITSSDLGVQGVPGLSAYVTSKHALIGLMRTAALECASLNIRVNTVNPAQTETPLIREVEEKIAPGAADTIRQQMVDALPMKRYCKPEEVAQLMLFLASDDSRYCTGGVYMIDGGSTSS
jgi:NAD(P)-dependent dehydrogenase (short-subunit alcohol dehydrogenase family)